MIWNTAVHCTQVKLQCPCGLSALHSGLLAPVLDTLPATLLPLAVPQCCKVKFEERFGLAA
jgi:hypothetical protein